MGKEDLTETIAAISTPIGEGGIGIVRISGREALMIADKIFVSSRGKPSGFSTYTIHYGKIVESLKVVDEVILTVMRAPKTYTKEDVVEINCHGGIVALRDVLDLVLKNGARLAYPGEFTKRAFLNGRIDLAQAEAVIDIIRAKTDSALRLGLSQLKGGLSKEINKFRESILDILVQLEASIDFPEEEAHKLELKKLSVKIEEINANFKNLIESSRPARVLREGIHLVICGKPNAGKSSLLNTLLKEERAIVTPLAGTTRDTIEEIIDIKGIPVRIVDTAGIIEPRDLVEKKALMRSKEEIELADLVIVVFDGSKKLSNEDLLLIKRLKSKTVIAVINKIDLKQRIDRKKLALEFKQLVDISAKKSTNIAMLEKAIADLIYRGGILNPESIMVSNLRHIQLVRKAQKNIAQAGESLDNELPFEFVAQDLREALGFLDEVLGKRFSADLLDKIFSEFCIGK
jgi:tRNA modification GTPase